ncbi:GNAT family N-acetyltransferase [Paenochrobactrum sp. BZR 588]|uniref:GNAT family N-acetyltransferase n=1 Tax=unclassified Paenochrobactrum TaxID=2639760 RepID=UPI00385326AD
MPDTENKTVVTRITYLELAQRLEYTLPVPAGVRLAIMRASDMPLHFYRYLYTQVGKDYNWWSRASVSDEELAAFIHSEDTEIHVLYVNGSPAGFCELNLKNLSDHVELVYFGLIGDFHGRGLSRFFLSEALSAAWLHEPQKLKLQTCSLDSPKALQLYQRMGFTATAWREEEVPYHHESSQQ